MENTHRNKSEFVKVLPVLFGFFIMGFCDLVGISVTYAKDQFGWSETQAGFLPSMVFIWFFILSIPAAMVMNKLGRKNTVLIAMLFTIIGMIIPVVSFGEITCYITFALLGIGNTILQVSLNPLLTNVIKGDKLTSSLTAGQFIKAISSFCGPIVAGLCSLHFGGWQMIFPVYAGVTLISSIWLLTTKIEEQNQVEQTSGFGQILGLLTDKYILLLFIGIICIVGLDVGMNTVTPKLLIERLALSKEEAGYGTSWYFAARTLGTLLSAFLLAKISGVKYFRINILIALLALVAICFAKSSFSILGLVCIIAFVSSSVFAVIYSMAIQRHPEKANHISGLMITGVAGGAIAPPLMGISTDIIGSQLGSILIIGICTLYLTFCAFQMSGQNKN